MVLPDTTYYLSTFLDELASKEYLSIKLNLRFFEHNGSPGLLH